MLIVQIKVCKMFGMCRIGEKMFESAHCKKGRRALLDPLFGSKYYNFLPKKLNEPRKSLVYR